MSSINIYRNKIISDNFARSSEGTNNLLETSFCELWLGRDFWNHEESRKRQQLDKRHHIVDTTIHGERQYSVKATIFLTVFNLIDDIISSNDGHPQTTSTNRWQPITSHKWPKKNDIMFWKRQKMENDIVFINDNILNPYKAFFFFFWQFSSHVGNFLEKY